MPPFPYLPGTCIDPKFKAACETHLAELTQRLTIQQANQGYDANWLRVNIQSQYVSPPHPPSNVGAMTHCPPTLGLCRYTARVCTHHSLTEYVCCNAPGALYLCHTMQCHTGTNAQQAARAWRFTTRLAMWGPDPNEGLNARWIAQMGIARCCMCAAPRITECTWRCLRS